MFKLLLDPVLFAVDPGTRELFVHGTSASGDTALIWAVRSGHIDIVLELYLHGLADTDHRNRLGSTAMHIAASLGNQEMIGALLDIGSEVSMRNAAGKTALHLVARQNNFQLVRQLVTAGVSIDILDIQGYTALHRATSLRHGAAVLALLAHGADANLPNNWEGLSLPRCGPRCVASPPVVSLERCWHIAPKQHKLHSRCFPALVSPPSSVLSLCSPSMDITYFGNVRDQSHQLYAQVTVANQNEAPTEAAGELGLFLESEQVSDENVTLEGGGASGQRREGWDRVKRRLGCAGVKRML